MPLYEYRCPDCDAQYEVLQRFSDPPKTTCDKCQGTHLEKLISAPAFQFKGSGWYVTDYARKGDGKANGDGKTESKKGDGDKGDATSTKSSDGDKSSSAGGESASKDSGDSGKTSKTAKTSSGDAAS